MSLVLVQLSISFERRLTNTLELCTSADPKNERYKLCVTSFLYIVNRSNPETQQTIELKTKLTEP